MRGSLVYKCYGGRAKCKLDWMNGYREWDGTSPRPVLSLCPAGGGYLSPSTIGTNKWEAMGVHILVLRKTSLSYLGDGPVLIQTPIWTINQGHSPTWDIGKLEVCVYYFNPYWFLDNDMRLHGQTPQNQDCLFHCSYSIIAQRLMGLKWLLLLLLLWLAHFFWIRSTQLLQDDITNLNWVRGYFFVFFRARMNIYIKV